MPSWLSRPETDRQNYSLPSHCSIFFLTSIMSVDKTGTVVNMERDADPSSGAQLGKIVSENGHAEMTVDPEVVKKLKLKADLILLPILTIAYLFKFAFPFLPEVFTSWLTMYIAPWPGAILLMLTPQGLRRISISKATNSTRS